MMIMTVPAGRRRLTQKDTFCVTREFILLSHPLQCSVFSAVQEHLPQIVISINDLVIHDFPAFFHRYYIRIDKTAIRFKSEGVISGPYFLMQLRIDIDRICLHQLFTCLVIPFGLNPLHFCKKFSEQAAKRFIIIDYEISLSVTDFLLDDIVRLALLHQSAISLRFCIWASVFLRPSSTRLNCTIAPFLI